MDHDAHDAHHGGAAVVDLGVELAGLLLGVLDGVTEPSDAVVAVVLGGGHPGELDEGEEEEDLEEAGGGDGADAVDAVGDVGELEVLRGGEVSVELDVVVVDDGTDDGSHGECGRACARRRGGARRSRARCRASRGGRRRRGGRWCRSRAR